MIAEVMGEDFLLNSVLFICALVYFAPWVFVVNAIMRKVVDVRNAEERKR